MRTHLPYFFLALMFFMLNISCESEEIPSAVQVEANPYSKSIEINFDANISSNTDHSYIYTGYTLVVQGFVQDTILYNVDLLSGPQEILTYGDVVVTLFHPDFIKTDLVESAYFGLNDYKISVESSPIVQVPLELVQGFVLVQAEPIADRFITDLFINGIEANSNTLYYTASEKVTLFVNSNGTYLSGSNELHIGEGVKYQIDLKDLNVDISFPDLDGNLPQPVITRKNVQGFESFTLYRDGTVTLYTGDYATQIFIPNEDISQGQPLGNYDLSKLLASWQSHHGKPDYVGTAYIDIFAEDLSGTSLKIRILSNEYIQVFDAASNHLIDQYGNNINAASNKKAYDQMLQDYGSVRVLNEYQSTQGVSGNFIWQAGNKRGAIYVENYELLLR